jgi:methylated-DNA-[protein]-cysteine S-methyltransferase
LIWEDESGVLSLKRLFLPQKEPDLRANMTNLYPFARESFPGAMRSLARDVSNFLEGMDVVFDLEKVSFSECSDFQVQVLLAEYAIPRGMVSTYGRIARFLGNPAASRAVGRALATNPFPIIIPCHRAVRATGELGGYQGGLDMKRTLLEMEGIGYHSPSRIALSKIYY